MQSVFGKHSTKLLKCLLTKLSSYYSSVISVMKIFITLTKNSTLKYFVCHKNTFIFYCLWLGTLYRNKKKNQHHIMKRGWASYTLFHIKKSNFGLRIKSQEQCQTWVCQGYLLPTVDCIIVPGGSPIPLVLLLACYILHFDILHPTTSASVTLLQNTSLPTVLSKSNTQRLNILLQQHCTLWPAPSRKERKPS